MTQSDLQRPLARVPGFIKLPGPIVERVLRAGLGIGPNRLITVRGRVTGELRTQPLAVVPVGSSLYVVGTFGDVNWCRNMRANPDVEVRLGDDVQERSARELSPDEATVFFRDTLPVAVSDLSPVSRVLTRLFIGWAAPDIRRDPAQAALRRPVFELKSMPSV